MLEYLRKRECERVRRLEHTTSFSLDHKSYVKGLNTFTLTMVLCCHQVNQVVVLQRAWRAHKARQDLHSITHQENPPMPVIRKFIHLLDVSPGDLDEEFRLQVLYYSSSSVGMTAKDIQ